MKISKTMSLNITQKSGKRQARVTLPKMLVEALGWQNKDKIKVRLDTKAQRLILTKK